MSDIPSPTDPVTPTSRGKDGAARLEEILQVGPGTRLDRRFIEELAAIEPASVVDLTDGRDASERTASQASTSSRKDFGDANSPPPSGEPIQSRQRPRSRPMRINDQRVVRRADMEMVDLASDRPVYSVDYFTSAVTLRYLATLREEFQILGEVDLVVPSENDIPSRPPPGHITLSADYFRAGLRLPFHPFLRRALTKLNVAPTQLNTKAYWVLISCYVLWAKHFVAKLLSGHSKTSIG